MATKTPAARSAWVRDESSSACSRLGGRRSSAITRPGSSLALANTSSSGGPINSTRVLGYHIYRTAFESQQYGEAATESVLFMILIASITFLQRRILRLTRSDVNATAA